jgi:toxin secretion/phage lysis holin
MERWDLLYRYGIACGGSFACYLYGGWSAVLGILLAFVVLDYLTGLLAAAIKQTLSSAVGAKGIAKKVCIFLMVAVAHLVDLAVGLSGDLIMNATIFFYLANELLSIVENVGIIGLPIPDTIQQAIILLKGKSEEKEE